MSTTTHKIAATWAAQGDAEIDAEIVFRFTPGHPAVMYLRNGDPGYPAEPAEVELISVTANVAQGDCFDDLRQKALDDWAAEWLADEGYGLACAKAEDERVYRHEY